MLSPCSPRYPQFLPGYPQKGREVTPTRGRGQMIGVNRRGRKERKEEGDALTPALCYARTHPFNPFPESADSFHFPNTFPLRPSRQAWQGEGDEERKTGTSW